MHFWNRGWCIAFRPWASSRRVFGFGTDASRTPLKRSVRAARHLKTSPAHSRLSLCMDRCSEPRLVQSPSLKHPNSDSNTAPIGRSVRVNSTSWSNARAAVQTADRPQLNVRFGCSHVPPWYDPGVQAKTSVGDDLNDTKCPSHRAEWLGTSSH